MKKRVTLLLLLLVLAVGCAPASGDAEGLVVTDVWGRTSPMAAQNGAFYLTITNNTGSEERLLSAQSDVCGTTELHEMYMREDDVMGMRPVAAGYITIPAGDTVALKVGGLHVMCIDKQAEFALGDEFPLVLSFANAGERTVTAVIREGAMEN